MQYLHIYVSNQHNSNTFDVKNTQLYFIYLLRLVWHVLNPVLEGVKEEGIKINPSSRPAIFPKLKNSMSEMLTVI